MGTKSNMSQSKTKFKLPKIKELMKWSELTSNKKLSIVGVLFAFVIVLAVTPVLIFVVLKTSPQNKGKYMRQ